MSWIAMVVVAVLAMLVPLAVYGWRAREARDARMAAEADAAEAELARLEGVVRKAMASQAARQVDGAPAFFSTGPSSRLWYEIGCPYEVGAQVGLSIGDDTAAVYELFVAESHGAATASYGFRFVRYDRVSATRSRHN